MEVKEEDEHQYRGIMTIPDKIPAKKKKNAILTTYELFSSDPTARLDLTSGTSVP